MNVKDNYHDKKMVARIAMLQKLCNNYKREYDVVKDKIIDRARHSTLINERKYINGYV